MATRACWMRQAVFPPKGFMFYDIDGTLHRALSPKPNSAYVLGKDGTILFRAQWANDTKALAGALEAIAAGESPSCRAVAFGPYCANCVTWHLRSTERGAVPGATCGEWRPPWRLPLSPSRLFVSAR